MHKTCSGFFDLANGIDEVRTFEYRVLTNGPIPSQCNLFLQFSVLWRQPSVFQNITVVGRVKTSVNYLWILLLLLFRLYSSNTLQYTFCSEIYSSFFREKEKSQQANERGVKIVFGLGKELGLSLSLNSHRWLLFSLDEFYINLLCNKWLEIGCHWVHHLLYSGTAEMIQKTLATERATGHLYSSSTGPINHRFPWHSASARLDHKRKEEERLVAHCTPVYKLAIVSSADTKYQYLNLVMISITKKIITIWWPGQIFYLAHQLSTHGHGYWPTQ